MRFLKSLVIAAVTAGCMIGGAGCIEGARTGLQGGVQGGIEGALSAFIEQQLTEVLLGLNEETPGSEAE